MASVNVQLRLSNGNRHMSCSACVITVTLQIPVEIRDSIDRSEGLPHPVLDSTVAEYLHVIVTDAGEELVVSEGE